MPTPHLIHAREYGKTGPWVILLHGGPGAPGYMAPIARELAGAFRILEPFQRPSGAIPLTVGRHIQDLHDIVKSRCEGFRPALAGSSWGAMLALAYASVHPDAAGPLVLIGSGTFDLPSRDLFKAEIRRRMSADGKKEMDRQLGLEPDPDRRLSLQGDLLFPLYTHDPVTGDLEIAACDARSNHETWEDMIRLQENGTYPAAFAAIKTPVLMLHGTIDPHPGKMIRDSLLPHIPHLEYREWSDCGHYPWLERSVRLEFFEALRTWLAERTGNA